MHKSLVTTAFAIALLTGPSVSAPRGGAPRLAAEAAPRAGAVWELELTGAPALPAGAALFAARGRDVHVLGRSGPDGRFQVELPAAPELGGAVLSVWAAGSALGTRWRTDVLQVTVDAGDGGYFDPSVDRFAITGCTLGCSGVAAQVSCAIVNVFVNQDLAVTFSQPVALMSVTPNSFRVFNALTGVAPTSSFFFLAPGDPNTLVFQPGLSFDLFGNPIFGFQGGASYVMRLPGVAAGDPGPYVSSITGAPLATRLLCIITADQGVQDYVPGPPTVVLDPPDGATGVPLDTDVTMTFQDIMNLATLVIPATGQAPFIEITVASDPSGTPLAGAFQFSVDQQAKTTTIVFDPAQDLPPGETILVDLPSAILDLVGNPLANAGTFAFTTVEP